MNFTGKNRLFRAKYAAPLISMMAGILAINSGVNAQEAQPELRDFKLEPEKPKPAPPPLPQADPAQTAPQPSVPKPSAPAPIQSKPGTESTPTAPKPKLTLPDIPATAQRTKPSAAQKPQAANAKTNAAPAITGITAAQSETAPNNETPKETTSVAPAVSADPVPEISAPQDTAAKPAEANSAAQDMAAETPPPAKAFPYIAALIALVGLGAIAAFAYLRRRKKAAIFSETISEHPIAEQDHRPIPTAETEPARSAPVAAKATDTLNTDPAPHIPTAPFASKPVSIPVPVSAPITNDARPQLEASFIPEKATISLAMLTIKGQIRIINSGAAEAKSVRLRAAIISANEQQSTQIKAFYEEPRMQSEEIGGVESGERVGMEIDLKIPLSELKSYPLGDRQLFVPIVVAHVDYFWGAHDERDEARISCMIGREATPPKPKMAPLRLDLGPRSIAHLGQRPVFA
jgi:hypothetical protein